jgi:predicted methyltransferase
MSFDLSRQDALMSDAGVNDKQPDRTAREKQMTTHAFRRIAAGCAILMMAFAAVPARAQDFAALIAAPDRTDADRATDKKRDPVKLLEFVAPKPGWRVLDMAAGAGYSTELMARAVAPGGAVFAQDDTASEKLAARLKTPAMAQVEAVTTPFDDLSNPSLRNLDLVTFFFGYHDTTFMAVDRARMNKALFDALKPGGLLVIADNSARPEDGATVGKTLHRIAEKTLRAEIEAAGFVFVADAGFLRHPEDERTAIVFKNPTPVDEFVLKFRKP